MSCWIARSRTTKSSRVECSLAGGRREEPKAGYEGDQSSGERCYLPPQTGMLPLTRTNVRRARTGLMLLRISVTEGEALRRALGPGVTWRYRRRLDEPARGRSGQQLPKGRRRRARRYREGGRCSRRVGSERG
jgi:hypothetical protein